jgi:RNase P/RNase MRP subunit POP5
LEQKKNALGESVTQTNSGHTGTGLLQQSAQSCVLVLQALILGRSGAELRVLVLQALILGHSGAELRVLVLQALILGRSGAELRVLVR